MRSIEFNWLRNLDKGLLMPGLVFTELTNCGGFYAWPTKGEYFVNDTFVPLDKGVIFLPSNRPECHSAVMAHEWRHHWQFYRGMLQGRKNVRWSHYESKYGWWKGVVRYIMDEPTEYDAMRYQKLKAGLEPYLEEALKDIVL